MLLWLVIMLPPLVSWVSVSCCIQEYNWGLVIRWYIRYFFLGGLGHFAVLYAKAMGSCWIIITFSVFTLLLISGIFILKVQWLLVCLTMNRGRTFPRNSAVTISLTPAMKLLWPSTRKSWPIFFVLVMVEISNVSSIIILYFVWSPPLVHISYKNRGSLLYSFTCQWSLYEY